MKTLPKLPNFEYRSKEEINGWPLIHINLGTHPETGLFGNLREKAIYGGQAKSL